MVRKFLTAFAILVFSVVGAQAGNLNVGVGYSDGHSLADTRCINQGVSLDVGYDWVLPVIEYGDIWLSLDAGPLFTYTNYDTAFRAVASDPMEDHRREHSLSLMGMVKPTIHYKRLSIFGMGGFGPDFGQEDGFSVGWTKGAGASIRITDRVSFSMTRRKMYRLDTGSMKHITGLITINF